MPDVAFFNVLGAPVAQRRAELGLTQKELAQAVVAYFEQNQDKYPKLNSATGASRITNIETSTPGDRESRKSAQAAQLLADALQVPLSQIAVAAEERRRGPRFKRTPDPLPPVSPDPLPPIAVMPPPMGRDIHLVGPVNARTTIALPFISVPARASFVEMCGPESTYAADVEYRHIKLGNNPPTMYANAKVFEVNGDSMEPEIQSGDEVIAVEVPEGKWELQQNCVLVVSFGDTLTIKKVIANDLNNKGTLTLRPWRDELAPFVVKRVDIRCMFRVLEVQRTFRPVV